MTRRIAPSILAADFGRLREEVSTVIDAGATVVHVDVMDGHFVPPITMGPNVVEALRDLGAHLDVHLMIERPERQIADFANAGAGTITIHAESTPHIDYALEHIRAAGCRPSLAVNPSTPLDVFREVDGGIDAETVGPCAEAGATLFVAGTAIFGAPDPARAFAELASKIGCS